MHLNAQRCLSETVKSKPNPNTNWAEWQWMVIGVLFILPFWGAVIGAREQTVLSRISDGLPTNHTSWYFHTYTDPFHIECEFALGN